jgi:hypothetical protein
MLRVGTFSNYETCVGRLLFLMTRCHLLAQLCEICGAQNDALKWVPRSTSVPTLANIPPTLNILIFLTSVLIGRTSGRSPQSSNTAMSFRIKGSFGEESILVEVNRSIF